jgi:hypothetical protein
VPSQLYYPQNSQLFHLNESLIPSEPQLVGPLGSPIIYAVTKQVTYTVQYEPTALMQPFAIINYMMPNEGLPAEQDEGEQ